MRERAVDAAQRLLDRVDHTMALEAQEPDEGFRARRVQEMADELVRTLSRELWDEGSQRIGNSEKTRDGER